jgi:hypothetical protein
MTPICVGSEAEAWIILTLATIGGLVVGITTTSLKEVWDESTKPENACACGWYLYRNGHEVCALCGKVKETKPSKKVK